MMWGRLWIFVAIVFSLSNAKSFEETMLPYMQFDPSRAISLLPKKYDYLKKAIKEAQKAKASKYTILYFFSETVPVNSFADHLIEIAKFNKDHKIHLLSEQSLIGMDLKLKSYLLGVRKHLEGLKDYTHEEDLIDIRMSPEVFEKYSIDRVPAIALAKCPSHAHPSDCSIVAMAKGDISLDYFFTLLDDRNLLPEDLK